MVITFGDLQRAMNSLRQEIPGLVAPSIAASITGLRSEIDVTVTAALTEVRQQNETTTQRVSVAVEQQFQKASAPSPQNQSDSTASCAPSTTGRPKYSR